MSITIVTTSDGLIGAQDSDGKPVEIIREQYWDKAGRQQRDRRARQLRAEGWQVKSEKHTNPFGGEDMYTLTATCEEEERDEHSHTIRH